MVRKKKPRPVRDREGSAPTPVRDLMRESGEKVPEDTPSPQRTEFESDGVLWEVEVAGQARSGTAPDSGARLLLLRFRRPETSDEGTEEREGWAVARQLADLSSVELSDLLARSRPRETDPPG